MPDENQSQTPPETTTQGEGSLAGGENAAQEPGGTPNAGAEEAAAKGGDEQGAQEGGEGKSQEPKGDDKGKAPEPLTAEAVKLPEGLEVNDALMEKFLGVMNDREMDPATRAQNLVDLQAEAVQEAAEKSAELWRDTQEEWVEEVKKDPDIGGDKFQPTIDRVGKLVDQYGSDELREILGLTGAGNNVHVVKFLNKIAKDLTEGGPVSGQTPGQSASPAEILYPTQGKE